MPWFLRSCASSLQASESYRTKDEETIMHSSFYS